MLLFLQYNHTLGSICLQDGEADAQTCETCPSNDNIGHLYIVVETFRH
jgi:hypothetical protein